MPVVYIPTLWKRLIELFHLHRWCRRCNDFVALLHQHHEPSPPGVAPGA